MSTIVKYKSWQRKSNGIIVTSGWKLYVHSKSASTVFVAHVFTVPRKMSKKRKLADGSRKLVRPIPLDSSGRPVFPIVLGGLTVYSLGEVSV